MSQRTARYRASASKPSLFGLGGGGRPSTPRGGAGTASKARKKVESNAAFQGRVEKVRHDM